VVAFRDFKDESVDVCRGMADLGVRWLRLYANLARTIGANQGRG